MEEKIDKEIQQEIEQEVSNLLPDDETTISLLKQEIESGAYDEKEKKELISILETLKAQKKLYSNSPANMQKILDGANITTRGGRKTKKKRSKNKKRRNKKSKTRRKKGGDVEKAASVINAVGKTIGRIFKTKGDIEKAQENKKLLSATKEQLSKVVDDLRKAPGAMKKNFIKRVRKIKESLGSHSGCLTAALLAQEGCILKNIKENDAFSASGSRGYVPGTDAKPSSLINKVCSVKSLQRIIPNWDSYKSKSTQFGCGEKIHSDMIELSGLKDKEKQRRLMENPQVLADLKKIRNRQQELKRRDEIAEKTGNYVLAEGKDNIFEDEVVVLGGRRKTKRRRNKKKRKTKKKRKRRRKK